MQLKRVKVEDYKCLLDFQVDFNIVDGGSLTVLIGENGTGKSTLLEFVLMVLMSFDIPSVEKCVRTNYEIEYLYAGSEIIIRNLDGRYEVFKNGSLIASGKISTVRNILKEKNISLFPKRIITFYSGNNDKLLMLIKKANRIYRNNCKKMIVDYIRNLSGQDSKIINIVTRKYNYCEESLTDIYLVALLIGNRNYEREYLQHNSHINKILYIDVELDCSNFMKFTDYGSERKTNNFILSCVELLNDEFYDVFQRGFLYVNYNKAYYTLEYFENINADTVSVYEFLEKLNAIFNMKIRVMIKIGTDIVESINLSEGQRQLIKVLGMLGVCKNEDCLVIMDEPDAHMNPKWKYEIRSSIEKLLGNVNNIQAIIATHEPLLVNGLDKEFIRIFTYNDAVEKYNNKFVAKAIKPQDNTIGMGIDGLLQSEYYGLSTVLDSKTQKMVDEKRDLMIKRRDNTITDSEKVKLNELTENIENLYFARNIPTNNFFDEFVMAMHEVYKNREKVKLSREEIEDRNKISVEIMERLMKK